jgi:phosphate transport system permease protein
MTATGQHIRSKFKIRRVTEPVVLALLVAASVVAVMTTVGIVLSVAAESYRFFNLVPFYQFLFGTDWSPSAPIPSFGFVPLITGTLLITSIAVIVATPLGLLAAIYLAEYATPRARALAKPLLELLAGIPTVVLGFFAALTVAPFIRAVGANIGLSIAAESALAAGLVMGMMIVPLISSLSDDVINAVPQAMRDGSYAMGATQSETIRRVVLPAALPGIVSALILAISRAIGETMIVVMAAGLAPNLTLNPLAAVTTVTVQINAMLVGDQEFDSSKTLSAFALGLTLFVITLVLNIVALRVVQKYKEQYA